MCDDVNETFDRYEAINIHHIHEAIHTTYIRIHKNKNTMDILLKKNS